ncbi:hypothetical protein KPB2_5341 [Klebsiella pneumoniae Kb677]|nr:hypothetical protein KPB2_5341 [Klebsiella pneumoniae Kb677]
MPPKSQGPSVRPPPGSPYPSLEMTLPTPPQTATMPVPGLTCFDTEALSNGLAVLGHGPFRPPLAVGSLLCWDAEFPLCPQQARPQTSLLISARLAVSGNTGRPAVGNTATVYPVTALPGKTLTHPHGRHAVLWPRQVRPPASVSAIRSRDP